MARPHVDHAEHLLEVILDQLDDGRFGVPSGMERPVEILQVKRF
jgi:hypothetical protein